ncbi:MAG: hypothetical protein H0V17_12875, partial [Deltaproteobacteria bacterium]|nr:hypothetical protein [Deltaproteobacteria bacterium]
RPPGPAPVGPAPIGPAPVAPAPPPTPTPDDPVLAEQVAQSLVHRAQELYDARVYVDAKQLAVEALVKSPKGAAAEHAKYLIKKINDQLGINETQNPTDPAEHPDLAPIGGLTVTPPKDVPSAPELPRASRLTTTIHTGLYAGLVGTTIGSLFSKDTPEGGAIPVGIGLGAVGGLYGARLVDKLEWNEGQIRTAGAGTVWGGVIGGLFGDIAKTDGTRARHVLVGASIGATIGGGAGVLLARDNRYTAGDIALVDTFAGIGTFGGFSLGMMMQPLESEAYSLNGAFGAAGGIVIGLLAAPTTNTTPRRMVRVAGAAAIGGASPFLLYAAIYQSGSTSDERTVGALSCLGLLAGTYVGFRITAGMDRGADAMPRKPSDQDAPASLLSRSSSGRWGMSPPAIQPLSRQLSPQPGMALSLVGATF